jgi:mannose-6-phosphate isomerase-like protein (cupin superfamily)
LAPSTTQDRCMTNDPISLQRALDSFDALWSPHIVNRVNDYDVRIAKIKGDFTWHSHADTDEFFLVLDGDMNIALREPAGQRVVHLPKGSLFTVPKATEHKPSAPNGASILLFEPTGTLNVGDRHDDIPGYVDRTTGHELEPRSTTDT